jgi:hypothetical protein
MLRESCLAQRATENVSRYVIIGGAAFPADIRRFWASRRPTIPYRIIEGLHVARTQSRESTEEVGAAKKVTTPWAGQAGTVVGVNLDDNS